MTFRITYSECVEPRVSPPQCLGLIQAVNGHGEPASDENSDVKSAVVFEHPFIVMSGNVYDLTTLPDAPRVKLKVIWTTDAGSQSRLEVKYESSVAGKLRKGRIETSLAEFVDEGLLYDTYTNVRSEDGNRTVSKVLVQLVAGKSGRDGAIYSKSELKSNE
ncbi:MAG: hypothetical protein AAGI72_10395 [Pseudomonadota bacterium]